MPNETVINKEINTTNNAKSPVIVNTVKAPPVFTPIKSCDKLRIMLVLQGSANAIIDGEAAALSENEIAVICPKSLFTITSLQNLQYAELTLDILPAQESLGRYLHFINGNLGVPTFIKNNSREHSDVFSAVTKLVIEQNDVIQNVESLLITLFNHRERNAAKNVSKDKQRYAIERILQRVNQITNTVVISDIANACGYSEFYTMKLFKQYTGETIVDYSNKYRIYVAANKLLTTDKSVCEIAQEVGFTNISYFNRQFKRMFNLTPLTARAAKLRL